ncbi:MAG TPA: response regulator [Pyrinomonadaceae bacterium]|nr:response regulator [Pyrinomonadaceae bacterium]
MKFATQLTTTELTRTSQARQCCELAKQCEKAGDYDAAREALSDFWPELNGQPMVDGLDARTTAEVFLRIGNISGWLGSARQSIGSQETAKNLITRSATIFEGLGEPIRIAEARADLGLCYWREGAFDEARDILRTAIAALLSDNDLRATALIRLAIVEKTAGRFNEALSIYREVWPLIETTKDDALKGSYHTSLATLLNRVGIADERRDYIDQALIEFAAASFHFEQAGNVRYCAQVEANLGFLFLTISRLPEAHSHIARARGLYFSLGDIGRVAQVDDTRARTLLAEGRYQEAERYARGAVRTLDRGDECSLLVEALTTHGVTLARLGNYSASRSELDRAIEAGENCGDLEGAGRARLSIIEELSGQTSTSEMAAIYVSALQVLKSSQDPSTTQRLFATSEIVVDTFNAAEKRTELKTESRDAVSFKKEVHAFERGLIERALRNAGGSVTIASRLLGFKHHQSLISLINTRHQELLKTRSTARKRRRQIVSKPKTRKKSVTANAKPEIGQISVLHVEDNKQVANVIKDFLSSEGMQVDSCGNGMTALRILTGDAHCDVVIVDNDLPGLNGLELVRRVHKITHRRNTPIIMLSGDEIETEAWRAGVKEFLRKPQDIDRVASTVKRLATTGKEEGRKK